jgi:hypothetical protein
MICIFFLRGEKRIKESCVFYGLFPPSEIAENWFLWNRYALDNPTNWPR